MTKTTRIRIRIAYGLASLTLVVCTIHTWGRVDSCGGWAREYATRAKKMRVDAETPGLTPDERKKHLIAADMLEIVSHKYSLAAYQPWRRIPSDPLVTPEEQLRIESKY